MIIKINEYESYTLTLPEELTRQQFFEFKSRLDYVAKLIGKDPLIQIAQEAPAITNPTKRIHGTKPDDRSWYQSRTEAINVLTEYYKLSGYSKEQFAYEHGITKNVLKNDMQIIRAKFSIQAQEVGLVEFPAPGHVPNFINNDETKKEDDKTEESETLTD